MAKTNPLVSVIIPTYNAGDYFITCLDSIRNQTYNNLEIIIIDDGSTDDSGRIADEYAQLDSRISVFHQKNSGQSAARNFGLTKVHGDYVSFIDSDDEIRPTFIETLVSLHDENHTLSVCGLLYRKLYLKSENAAYSKPYHVQKKNETIKKYVIESMVLDGRMYPVINKLFKTSIIRNNNLLFEEDRNFGEDTMFVLNYINVMNGGVRFSLEPLYIYNSGTASSTVRKSGIIKENWNKLYSDTKKWLGNPKISELFWLKALWLRWKISYFRSKRRAKMY